jgi:1-deoxy-D-xylulose-5-phosphate reductoisomerase
MPAVMNAANEVAVGAFLDGRAAFAEIPEIIAKTMRSFANRRDPSLDEIIEADKSARGRASECIRR